MAEKKTLLDLDRLPTLEEMQDFFKENDWSAAKIFTEPELTDAISHGKELLAPVLEKAMQEHGLGVWSGYFDNKVRVNGTTFQQNPLIAFRDNFEDLVTSIVAKLQYETPEEAQQIIDQIKESNIDPDELLSFMYGQSFARCDRVQRSGSYHIQAFGQQRFQSVYHTELSGERPP